MIYLLVTHVPMGRGDGPGRVRIGDLWLEDLRAQARAVTGVGGRLVVATPTVDRLEEAGSGSFHLLDIRPQDHGFTHVPLPRYLSMRQFIEVRRSLIDALRDAVGDADLVQMGYGGHPVALGQVAWPVAGELGARRIWVFDGADPFPRLQREARAARNPLKRAGKRAMLWQFHRFCEQAVRDADLVFSHNAAVTQRFAHVWGPHCHTFDRSFVTDEVLIGEDELAARNRALREQPGPLKLVAAGRQVAIKGTDHLLEAVALARGRGAELELEIIGDGRDLEGFKRAAAQLGLSDAVRFRGRVPYGPALFEAWSPHHAMVVTNLTDEISRNVLLSLARGLALITYGNPGTDTLLNEADAAMVVERGNVAALAEALTAAARHRARLAELAVNGWKLARRHSLDATHRQRAELAAALLKGHPQAAGVGELEPTALRDPAA